MRCRTCGRENLEGFKFCQSCGSIIAEPIDLRDRRLDPARESIIQSIRGRKKADRMLSTLWIVVIVLAYVVYFVVAMAYLFSLFDASEPDTDEGFLRTMVIVNIASAIPMIIVAALVFLLVKRQDDHYSRETRLRSAIMNLIRTAAWSPERENDVAPEIAAMATVVRRQERPRNPWFWSLILLVPMAVSNISFMFVWRSLADTGYNSDLAFVQTVLGVSVGATVVSLIILVLEFYLLYFLTKTMLEHDTRWGIFAYNSGRALVKLGFPANLKYDAPQLPERSMALYIILTLFTGVFLLYWTYVLIKDPNEHFRHHRQFEDNLMATLTRPSRYAIAVPATQS